MKGDAPEPPRPWYASIATSDGEPTPLALPRPYSKAYDAFVEDKNDVVGLLAYALFKGIVRDDALRGAQTGNARDPGQPMVEHMRSTAEQKLRELIDANLEEAAPELQLSAAAEAAQAAETNLSAKIDSAISAVNAHTTTRTSSFTAFVIAVAAWVATLGLTVLIIVLSHAADPIKATVHAAQQAGRQAENVVGGAGSTRGQ